MPEKEIPAMFKSAVSAVVLACVIVVVTSVGAVALRLYCLACRARAALRRNWSGYAAKPASR
jgi:hypothetical protein